MSAPESAVMGTPLNQLIFPANLMRANTSNQHKWNDKGRHSGKTIIIVI